MYGGLLVLEKLGEEISPFFLSRLFYSYLFLDMWMHVWVYAGVPGCAKECTCMHRRARVCKVIKQACMGMRGCTWQTQTDSCASPSDSIVSLSYSMAVFSTNTFGLFCLKPLGTMFISRNGELITFEKNGVLCTLT